VVIVSVRKSTLSAHVQAMYSLGENLQGLLLGNGHNN